MIDFKIITELLQRYGAGTATSAEQEMVERWLQENELENNEWAQMDQPYREYWIKETGDRLLQYADQKTGSQGAKIRQRHPGDRRFYFHLAAASVIILTVIGSWYFIKGMRQEISAVKKNEEVVRDDVPPGSNKAVLTLADGGTVVLDDVNNGVLTDEGGTRVSKQGDALVYSQEQKSRMISTPVYNILTTPKGGQYSLVLPDGSRVWLNAASSIRYPVAFVDDFRLVEVKGEVYFEVAPYIRSGKKIPFRVKILSERDEEKSQVEVMGTHFNINAYDEEASVNTTLLEGKVKVSIGMDTATGSAVLAPGQQAQVRNSHNSLKIKVIKDVNLDEVVAWKNGLFMMNSAAIPSVLRQFARWYDVDVVYEEGIPEGRITGDIPRDMNLSEALKIMELSGVHFKIEDRKIIVNP
ncbi:MAG: DUF4974 domain-containing protein [Chitinophagaceae bacterium]|nr:DUF4974 domain-containing protein [Chitinophagaceae bacterium]